MLNSFGNKIDSKVRSMLSAHNVKKVVEKENEWKKCRYRLRIYEIGSEQTGFFQRLNPGIHL